PINDGLRLPDQLIHLLFGNRAVAVAVYVSPVSNARRLSIDEHAKSHGISSGCRSHNQVKIAGMKAVGYSPIGLVQENGLFLHCPIPGKSPMIESQLRRSSIEATLVPCCTAGGRKVLGALIADIVFLRLQVAP